MPARKRTVMLAGPLYAIGPGFVPHGMLLLSLLVFGPLAMATIWLGTSLLRGAELEEKSILVRAERAS